MATGAQDRLRVRILPVVVTLTSAALLYVLRPLVVSGDGVGYIKRLISPERDVVPGHLIYVPFLEELRILVFPHGGHADAAMLATLVSVIGGAIGSGLLCLLVNRLTDRWWPGVLAAAGLCVSFGFYRASGDVEAYATATSVLIAIACCLVPAEGDQPIGWGRTIAAGLLLGLATLLHTSLVLFTPFVLVAGWRASGGWTKPIVAVVVGGALSAGTFVGVTMGALGMDVGGAFSWLMTSDNGYAQPPSFTMSFIFRNLGRLFYGIGRSFVHSPAPDRLGVHASVTSSAIGLSYVIVVTAVTVWGIWLAPASLRRRLRTLWAWIIPLLLFGFLFFPAATERWVFILPCLWLVIALSLVQHRRRWVAPIAAAFMLVVPIVVNIVTVSQERELDRRTVERSRAISAVLRTGDLLLYPGHTWDEYIGFYEDAPVERFILASFAGEEQGNREAFLARLRHAIDSTLSSGGRVIAVRVFDAPDTHHGWSLLRALGIPRDDVLALLAEYQAEELMDRPVGVWEILPADATPARTVPHPGVAVSSPSRHQGRSSAR